MEKGYELSVGRTLHAPLCTRLATQWRFLLLLKEKLSRGRIFRAIVALEKDYRTRRAPSVRMISDPPPTDGLSSHRPQVHELQRVFFLLYVGDAMDVAFSDAGEDLVL